MIDLSVLNKFGSTNARLREIFEIKIVEPPKGEAPTEKPADNAHHATRDKWARWEKYWQTKKDAERRDLFSQEIRSRFEEALRFSMGNSRLYQAVDLAWDTPGITGFTVPLMLYAQRKIDIQACVKDLKNLTNSQDFLVKNPVNGDVTDINMPKFVDVAINLPRSYITRRLAAQANKFNNLFPYLKYESRSTGQLGKLRADVMSQEAEVVVDSYDWKHHDEQCIRDGLLYGRSVDFVRSAWESEKQFQFKSAAKEFELADPKDRQVESVIMKEGISFVNPHPSRLILDNSEGVCSINTDGGAQYIGYWDVCRYADIKDNPAYFNRDAVTYGAAYWEVFANYPAYFNQYYSQLKIPQTATVNGWLSPQDPTANNDRKNLVGTWSSKQSDMAMFKTEYFRKLVPKDIGCGEYPFPVWVRFVVAGESTVIYAQFLPSTPAAVLSINEKDDRQINASFAMDLLWAQDMMSNLVNNLLLSIQQDLFKVFGVNKDVLEPDEIKKIESHLKGMNWANDPLVIPFSVKNMADELGIKMDAIFKISETRGSQNLQAVFQAMVQLMSLVDRMLAMSPAENGQPAPREISATEVAEISTTTTSVYSFISDDIDEFRAAKKRILYDSMVVCRQRPIMAPVLGRYTRKTVEAAGFSVVGEDESADPSQTRTVTGGKRLLVHDYIFTTRDGAERPVNTQSANTLVQLLQVVLQVPTVVNKLGKEKIYNMFNEVFRLSGAGVDLNLEMADGEEEDFGEDQMKQLSGVIDQLKQLFGQLADAVQQNSEGLATQEQVNAKQQAMLEGLTQLANLVKSTAAKTMNQDDRIAKLEANPVPAIQYKEAPADVRRQIEARNGFVPSTCETCDDGEAAAQVAAQSDAMKLDAEAKKKEIELRGAAAATTQNIVHREAEHTLKLRHKKEEAEARREQRRIDMAAKKREKAAAATVPA